MCNLAITVYKLTVTLNYRVRAKKHEKIIEQIKCLSEHQISICHSTVGNLFLLKSCRIWDSVWALSKYGGRLLKNLCICPVEKRYACWRRQTAKPHAHSQHHVNLMLSQLAVTRIVINLFIAPQKRGRSSNTPYICTARSPKKIKHEQLSCVRQTRIDDTFQIPMKTNEHTHDKQNINVNMNIIKI